MAQNSWPFEISDTTEIQFSKWASTLVDSGLIDGLEVTPGAGLSVSVAPGAAIVQGFYFENTTPLVIAIPGAAATARKDAIVLRMDVEANSIAVVAKEGSTAGGGTLPALEQSESVWEHLLAAVTVPGNAIGLNGSNISMVRTGASLRVYPYPTGSRPTPAAPVALGVDTTARQMEIWVGGAWYSLNPAPSWNSVTGKPGTYPPSGHKHDAGDIDTGTLGEARIPNLPASKISDATATGRSVLTAADRKAALNALGIYPQATQPPIVAGNIWIKTSA